MIKSWNIFLESREEDFNIILKQKLEEIGDLLQDLKDEGVIESYQVCPKDSEGGYRGQSRETISKLIEFIDEAKLWVGNEVCLSVNLRIPGEKLATEGQYRNSILGQEGFFVLEEIINTQKQLANFGYQCKFDLNGSHPLWKPGTLFIYFNT